MDYYIFFFSSRRRHTRFSRDWSSDVCSSDLLELVVLIQPVRVLAVAAVGGAARGLHVRDAPGLGPEDAQVGRRVHRAGPDLLVVALREDAVAARPVRLELQDEVLEIHASSPGVRAPSGAEHGLPAFRKAAR